MSDPQKTQQFGTETSTLDAVGETVGAHAPASSDPLIGTVFDGKYVVDALIGVGGMGKVYRGRNLRTEHSIAIKTLMPELVHDDSLVRRFEVEAKAASNLSHPNTIRVYDHGNEGKLLWMVMELLDGHSLERALSTERTIEQRRLIGLMRQVCASLAEAHGKGLVHRDLKPDNIFLNRAGGETDFVKVLDFGVAKLKDPKFGSEKLTQAGMIFGTPRYMSPEQARAKELDERSDIYALGVIMFECLTGRPPFEASDPIGVLVKHCNEPVPSFESLNPSVVVDPGFESLVRRCLAKKPEQRPESVKVLRAELEALDARIASGRPASSGSATHTFDAASSPPDTLRDERAPDTFDRLGISSGSDRAPANPSIAMHSESHRAVHEKAPLGMIIVGALGVLLAGGAALTYFSKSDAPKEPAPAAERPETIAAPTPDASGAVAGSGVAPGSGTAGLPVNAQPVAAPDAPAVEPAAPIARPVSAEATSPPVRRAPRPSADGQVRPKTSVVTPEPPKRTEPAKKTEPPKIKPGEMIDPYAE